MSIRPLDNSQRPRPVQGGAEKNPSASNGGGIAFGALLGEADKRQSAAALAEIMRIQMMRGSLDLDGESDSPSAGGMGEALLQMFQSRLLHQGQKPDTPAQVPLLPPPLLADPPRVSEMADPVAQSRGANLYRRQSSGVIQDIINRASRAHDLDPALVKAVIRAESDFDPKAVSHVGASGLMQLMPGTARDLGVSDPFDPEQNVMGGTRYLRQMLDRYDGDLDSALAAYNWGPGNFDRNNRNLTRLPEETRTYIARIRRFLNEEA